MEVGLIIGIGGEIKTKHYNNLTNILYVYMIYELISWWLNQPI